jgi:hypothetical protein
VWCEARSCGTDQHCHLRRLPPPCRRFLTRFYSVAGQHGRGIRLRGGGTAASRLHQPDGAPQHAGRQPGQVLPLAHVSEATASTRGHAGSGWTVVLSSNAWHIVLDDTL